MEIGQNLKMQWAAQTIESCITRAQKEALGNGALAEVAEGFHTTQLGGLVLQRVQAHPRRASSAAAARRHGWTQPCTGLAALLT